MSFFYDLGRLAGWGTAGYYLLRDDLNGIRGVIAGVLGAFVFLTIGAFSGDTI